MGICSDYRLSRKFFAQDSIRTPLALGKIEPYKMEVTYDKTSHLIFPTAIRYVDLGSEYLIAGKAEDAENVLRVKASVRNFEPETNFSVITNDGRFTVSVCITVPTLKQQAMTC